MTWQEELRRLDAELAAGAITPTQHRKQREDVLAEASGSPAVSPIAASRGEAARTEQPEHSEQSAQPGQAPAAEAKVTNQLGPAALLATTRQTTAPSPADERATESIPYPNVAPPAPVELTMPIGRVPPVQPGPLAQPRSATPMARREEPYREPPENRGTTRTWLLIAMGVLIALAAVIGGAWWLGTGSETPAKGEAQADRSTQPAQVALENRLPAMPGRPSPDSSTMTVDRGADLGLYSAGDAQSMLDNGATKVIYRASAEGPGLTDGYTIIAIPTSSEGNASELTDQLSRSVTTQGFSREPLGDNQPFVALSRTDSSGRVSVVWYASGKTVVGVGVSQAASADQNLLRGRLVKTLASVEAVLPHD